MTRTHVNRNERQLPDLVRVRRTGSVVIATIWLLAFCAAGAFFLLRGSGNSMPHAGGAGVEKPLLVSSGSSDTRRIEDIRAGDHVWACDPTTGHWSVRQVLQTTVREYSGDIVTVTVSGQKIEATGNHPFWVVAGEALDTRPPASEEVTDAERKLAKASGRGQWVQARHLRTGDSLILRNGDLATIQSFASRQARLPVYNFAVSNDRTYAVGTSGILVHNNQNCLPPSVANGNSSSGSTVGSTLASPQPRFIADSKGNVIDTQANPTRFIADSKGNVVDAYSTPKGSYSQPNGGRTDIAQAEDHGAGHSHTHDPLFNTNPRTGQVFPAGLSKPGRPVSAEDVNNIISGAATRAPPKGR